jgi:DNA-binding SARP family transcriptional activator
MNAFSVRWYMQEMKEAPASAPLRLVTFGVMKLLWLTHGEERNITYEVYNALDRRGPALGLLKVLVCSGPVAPRKRGAASSQPMSEEVVHEASRETLIEALWPEEGMQLNTERSLRKAKSVLNQVLRPYLGRDLVLFISSPGYAGYRLAGDLVRIDADEFELAVARACAAEGRGEREQALVLWETAYDLARGEFLPHEIYADWTSLRRERLRAKTRLCLHRLAALYREQQRESEAIEILHPWLLENPHDLDALRLLVPLLMGQQRYQEALWLCDSLERALMEEEEDLPQETADELAELTRCLEHAMRQARKERTPLPAPATTARSLTTPAVPGPLTTRSTPITPGKDVRGDGASWFDLTLRRVHLLVAAFRGRAMYCEELQAILNQELAMSDLVHSLFEDFSLTRRKALLALASLSAGLIGAVRDQPTSLKLLEQFLPQCAASITACTHLMRGSDFWAAEKALKQYMPVLEYVAQKPSLYQQAAARLAAQGRMMLAILAWHRFDVPGRIQHYSKALDYSRLTEDLNLRTIMLANLGHTYAQIKEPQKAMIYYQEALQHEQGISPFVHSFLDIRMAFSSAQLRQEFEARAYLDSAYKLYPQHPEDDASFSFSEFNRGALAMVAGWTYFELSKPQNPDDSPDKAYLEQAWNAYTSGDPLASLGARGRVEIANHQAATALAQRDLEKFRHYFLEGVRGAQALNSQKRKQEAVENWKAAKKVWGSEPQILELAEELMGQ